MYADYKGGRAKTPDEFREQLPTSVKCLVRLALLSMIWKIMKLMTSSEHWIN